MIGGIGRGLILFGTLILLFVAYQLWGTGLHESRAQDRLADEFEAVLEAARQPKPVGSAKPAKPKPVVIPETGDVIAHLRIPAIGVDKYIVEGVTISDLKNAPGHYTETVLPGHKGNAAIAGHRTTYGAPFYRLNELKKGDQLIVTTVEGQFVYKFKELKVVAPSAVEVLDPTKDSRLTLTTCNPRYSARERLIAIATLTNDPVKEVAPPKGTTGPQPTTTLPGEAAAPGETTPESLDLSGNPAARAPAILWGALSALVLTAVWAAGRWWRKWPAYIIGTPVFLVVLFFFFENFARLLPPNV